MRVLNLRNVFRKFVLSAKSAWEKSSRSDVFQFFWLGGCIFIMAFVFEYVRFGEFPIIFPTASDALLFFVLCIAIFHAWFYFSKNEYRESLKRIIDYVYLTYAAIGLLSASDLAIKHYTTFSSEMRQQSSQALHTVSYVLTKDKEVACSIPAAISDCRIYSEIIKLSDNNFELVSKELFPMSSVLESLKSIYKFEQRYPVIRIKMQEWQPDIESAMYFVKPLVKAPYGVEPQEAKQIEQFRSFGYLLLAAALALRITRVTIEWKRWYHIAKPNVDPAVATVSPPG